jgi:hypothetical protein
MNQGLTSYEFKLIYDTLHKSNKIQLNKIKEWIEINQ